jgi:ABC-type Mn2+/Zn2+ transport system permease subunit
MQNIMKRPVYIKSIYIFSSILMSICIVILSHSHLLFHCISPHFSTSTAISLLQVHPFFLSCLPSQSSIYIIFTSPFHSLSLLTVPSFSASFTSHTNRHWFPISVLCTHIPQFSALIYLFHLSNQSFAMIHIAIVFLIYLPR